MKRKLWEGEASRVHRVAEDEFSLSQLSLKLAVPTWAVLVSKNLNVAAAESEGGAANYSAFAADHALLMRWKAWGTRKKCCEKANKSNQQISLSYIWLHHESP